eukprot:m.79240 g.79240  ORF g.79240 m.79240 type:complete len:909 (+) comp8599_c0_seq1:137-2863(+)
MEGEYTGELEAADKMYDILHEVGDYVEIDDEDEEVDEEDEKMLVKSAPPRAEWLHGPMSRDQAKDLFVDKPEGSFFVRSSITNVGDLSLSFLTPIGVKHVKIIAHEYGDFFVADQIFSTLEDVVEYYFSHPLYEKTLLEFPIRPKEQLSQEVEMAMIALKEHRASSEDELSFQAGDRLTVKKSENEFWVYCVHDNTLQEGWAPKQLLKSLPQGTLEKEAIAKCKLTSQFQRKNWLHGRISSDEAKKILYTRGRPGAFLIRESANRIGNFTLSFFPLEEKIEHFRIEVKDLTTYFIGGRQFDCLEEVVLHYQSFPLSCNVTLSLPIPPEREIEADSYLEPPSVSSIPPKPEAKKLLHVEGEKWMEGYVSRKLHNKKNWKRLFFAVNPVKMRLEARESVSSIKPKHILDLGDMDVFPLHDSYYGRPHCFQLVLGYGTMDICCDSEDDKIAWISSFIRLGVRCFTKVTSATYSEPTRLANLQVTIKEVKGPIKASHIQCHLFLNKVKQACSFSRPYKNQSCFFGDQFQFLNLDEKVKSLQLALFPKKFTKRPPLASTEVLLTSIPRNTEGTRWIEFPEGGSIRVDFLFEDEVLLPTDEYASFKRMLLSEDLTLVYLLATVFKSKLNQFSKYLVRLWTSHGVIVKRLQALAQQTIEDSDEVGTLFRGNSLTSKCIELFMRQTGLPFLRSCIGEPIDELMNVKVVFELDPVRGGKEENLRPLIQFCKRVSTSIFRKWQKCPKELSDVLEHIRLCSMKKFPQDKFVQYTSVSAFAFLRFFCPAILNPKLFNLMKDVPTEGFARNLTLVAKVMQNLANMTEFGQKQDFMVPCNGFLIESRKKMQEFIYNICHSNGGREDLVNTETYDLAMLLRSCLQSRDTIEAAIKESGMLSLRDFPPMLDKFQKREDEIKKSS